MSGFKAIGFAGGQFGDLVMQLVPARVFKETHPGSHLTFAMADKYRDILPLFVGNPDIDAFHVWEGYDRAWPTPADQGYIEFSRFDHVYTPMPGHTEPSWYNRHHYLVENCLRFGLPAPKDISYRLHRWFPLLKGCEKIVTLSLFPSGGGQPNKSLNVAASEWLCWALRAKGYTPVQLGGRYEVKISNALNPSLSILEATQLMVSSKLHVTADTFFAWAAAGYSHPTIGFYSLNYPDMTDCFSHLPPNSRGHYLKNCVPPQVTADQLLAIAEREGLL